MVTVELAPPRRDPVPAQEHEPISHIGSFESSPYPERVLERATRAWRTFDKLCSTVSGLAADRMRIIQQDCEVVARTKPTNIGMSLVCLLAAEAIGELSETQVDTRVAQILSSVCQLETHQGFFYDWYDTETLQKLLIWPESNKPLPLFISSVDNAWLAICLLVMCEAKPQFADTIRTKILQHMDFENFFNPEAQEYHGGLFVANNELTAHTYSRRHVSETRCIAWAHAALTDDPQERIKILERLLTQEKDVPKQAAGGSMFELLLMRIFHREPHLWPIILEQFELHLAYGVKHLQGTVGVTVTDKPGTNVYTEAGVGGWYQSATFVAASGAGLALFINPEVAWHSLATLEKVPQFYDELGPRAAADFTLQSATNTVVCVDQAMFILSLVYHGDDRIADYFERYFRLEEMQWLIGAGVQQPILL